MCTCDNLHPIVGAVGPEVDQAARAGASMRLGLLAGTVVQGRPTGSAIDRRSPQHFVSHPRIVDAVSTTAAGDDTTRESLPGRIGPSVWDGEASWLNAIGG